VKNSAMDDRKKTYSLLISFFSALFFQIRLCNCLVTLWVIAFLILTIDSTAQKLLVSDFKINETGNVSALCTIQKHHSDREQYKLTVYASHDNYAKPLDFSLVGISPDKAQLISFDAAKLVGNYNGMLNFRFAITATQFPVELVNVKSKIRRGKNITLNWSDFHSSGLYKIELYKSNQLITVLAERVNGTSFKGMVPKTTRKGSDYSLRVTPISNSALKSDDYGIKVISKTGLMVKVIPVLVGGTAVYMLASQSKPDSGFPEAPGTPD